MKKSKMIALLLVLALGITGCGFGDGAGDDGSRRSDRRRDRREAQEQMADKAQTEDDALVEPDQEITKEEYIRQAIQVIAGCSEEECYELYLGAVEAYQQEHGQHKSDYTDTHYQLIDFDGDELPELVCGLYGYYVDMYTIRNGALVPIMDSWAYGAAGNTGYTYLEGQGIIFNVNSDYAGLVVYYNYEKFNNDTLEFEPCMEKELFFSMVKDVNGNGNIEYEEIEASPEEFEDEYYFYGDQEITQEEFEAKQLDGEYKDVCEGVSYEEIVVALTGQPAMDFGEDKADNKETTISVNNLGISIRDNVMVTPKSEYAECLRNFMQYSSYDTGEYLIDGIGDGIAYDPADGYCFALQDLDHNGVEELMLAFNVTDMSESDWVYVISAEKKWNEGDYIHMYSYYDDLGQRLVQCYGLDGPETPCDGVYDIGGQELTLLSECITSYDQDREIVEITYADGTTRQTSAAEVMASRPPAFHLQFYRMTPENITVILDEEPLKVVVATPDGGVNVRSGAGTEYDKLFSMVPDGTTFDIIDIGYSATGTEWGKINYNGKYGWISMSQVHKAD